MRSVQALIAKERWNGGECDILRVDELDSFTFDTSLTRCQKCNNHCQLTITKFSDGSQFVSGNRCERGAGLEKSKKQMPNLYDYKYKRAFAYKPLKAENAPNGVIGIPRVLNIYENYPLWFTFFTELGFSVRISAEVRTTFTKKVSTRYRVKVLATLQNLYTVTFKTLSTRA